MLSACSLLMKEVVANRKNFVSFKFFCVVILYNYNFANRKHYLEEKLCQRKKM